MHTALANLVDALEADAGTKADTHILDLSILGGG